MKVLAFEWWHCFGARNKNTRINIVSKNASIDLLCNVCSMHTREMSEKEISFVCPPVSQISPNQCLRKRDWKWNPPKNPRTKLPRSKSSANLYRHEKCMRASECTSLVLLNEQLVFLLTRAPGWWRGWKQRPSSITSHQRKSDFHVNETTFSHAPRDREGLK